MPASFTSTTGSRKTSNSPSTPTRTISATLQTFRELAAQQEVYLLRIANPRAPDMALYPDWMLVLPLTLIGGAMAYGILRMVMALGRDRWR